MHSVCLEGLCDTTSLLNRAAEGVPAATGGACGGDGEGSEGEGGRRGGEEAGTTMGKQLHVSSRHSSSSSASDDEMERVERERREVVMVEVGKAEWDCESILRYIHRTTHHPSYCILMHTYNSVQASNSSVLH